MGPMRYGLIAAGLLIVATPTSLEGQRVEEARSKWPVGTSIIYLFNASAGAVFAVRDDLRQEPFGIRTGRSAKDDFFFGTGTALSPGLPFLLTQSVATAMATGTGQSRRYGLIGLAIHGIGYTVGALAEPITYERLARPLEKALQTLVVIGNVVWPVAMAVLSIRELQR